MENEEDVKACIRYLRKFHDMKLEVNHAFDLYAEIRLYEGQCGMYFDAFPDVRETREKDYVFKRIDQEQTDAELFVPY